MCHFYYFDTTTNTWLDSAVNELINIYNGIYFSNGDKAYVGLSPILMPCGNKIYPDNVELGLPNKLQILLHPTSNKWHFSKPALYSSDNTNEPKDDKSKANEVTNKTKRYSAKGYFNQGNHKG